MFEKVLHHKLLSSGEQGKGVITSSELKASDGIRGKLLLHGHIKFPDGSQTEFASDWLNSHDVGHLREGSIVPVRYDGADHSKVVLDVPALEAKQKAVRADAEATLKASAERRIAAADEKLR